ncbi:MAG: hypothetical protein U0791_04075 [Gemmataceae bacterium]
MAASNVRISGRADSRRMWTRADRGRLLVQFVRQGSVLLPVLAEQLRLHAELGDAAVENGGAGDAQTSPGGVRDLAELPEQAAAVRGRANARD